MRSTWLATIAEVAKWDTSMITGLGMSKLHFEVVLLIFLYNVGAGNNSTRISISIEINFSASIVFVFVFYINVEAVTPGVF